MRPFGGPGLPRAAGAVGLVPAHRFHDVEGVEAVEDLLGRRLGQRLLAVYDHFEVPATLLTDDAPGVLTRGVNGPADGAEMVRRHGCTLLPAALSRGTGGPDGATG